MATKKTTSGAQKSAKNSAKKPTRGKPFSKGNEYAWKPGASGNPGGRPKSKRFSEGARRWLEAPCNHDPSKSNADALVDRWGEEAFENLAALFALLDRAEGRPVLSMSADVKTTYTRDDERLRKDALQSYNEFLAVLDGDEEKAKEMVRECAPTLAQYLD